MLPNSTQSTKQVSALEPQVPFRMTDSVWVEGEQENRRILSEISALQKL